MTTLETLQAKIAKLQTQAEAIAKKESSTVIAKIRDIMEKHGLTTADIEAHIGSAKKRGRKPGVEVAVKSVTSAAKYQDPKTGATWTGYGRAPAWIANAKDRSKFLIDGSGAAAGVAAANKSKAAVKAAGKTTAKSKLPPKYRNPATGETWSGHARPPAWIKDVKDRSKFLIAGAGEGTTESKAAAAKKAAAPAQKTAAKKSATKKSVAKKASAKKVASTAKKAPTKKTAVKKAAAKKVGVKKVVVRKAVASSAPPAQARAQAADSAGATTIA